MPKKPKIAFFELEPWEKDYFKKKLRGFALEFFDDPINEKSAKIIRGFDAISIFVYDKIDRKILRLMPRLKFIATRSTGWDHIDLKACKSKKITVSFVPSYGTNTVAEHAFALILALSRKIVSSVDRTRKGDFSLAGLRGTDLKGKTLGVIGTGKIGCYMIKIAKGFGMKVVAYDLFPKSEFAKEIGFDYKKSVEAVMKESDILTLHTIYTKKTHHLINKKNISRLKKGAILINTARGGLIETEAILEGLRQKIISAVGLDVLEEECLIKEERELLSGVFAVETCDLRTAYEEHVLLAQPNVIITPHNAFNSKEALYRILETTVENINGFFAGTPENLIRPRK